MADHRHHPPRHARRWYRSPLASWTAWFVAIAGQPSGGRSPRSTPSGVPSPTTLPVLWISPAALVILAVWWNGARGAAIATVAVTAGALVPTVTGDATPFTAAQWVLLALAAVAGPTVAAAGLRRAHADLRRPGLFDTGRFVAVVVAATMASGGATVALLALWGRTPPDVIAAVRSLAITDLSAIVVVVPVAFVTRGAGVRRRTRSARPSPPAGERGADHRPRRRAPRGRGAGRRDLERRHPRRRRDRCVGRPGARGVRRGASPERSSHTSRARRPRARPCALPIARRRLDRGRPRARTRSDASSR